MKNNIEKGQNFKFNVEYMNKSAHSISMSDYGHVISRADWWRRWLYSTNAKDIGMLYIYFAIFSGVFIMPLQNLAICWKLLKFNYNYLNLRQSAGNLKGLSLLRILRDLTQELSILSKNININKYIYVLYRLLVNNVFCLHTKINVEKNKYPFYSKDNQLGYYLAGLIEADGSIIIPKEESKNTSTINISFNIEDKPLALCIKDRLGFGSLESIEKNKAVRLVIRGKYSIFTLINIVNGKFRTPKIEKLYKLINYVNKNWIKLKENFIVLKPLDTSLLSSNNWLAGFSDGDANININITWPDKSKNGYGQIRLTFEVVQSRMDNEHLEKYKNIMNIISIFLKSKLEIHNLSKFDRSGKQKAWRAIIANKESATILINYFDQSPMFSSKYLNYQDWCSVYDMLIVKKEHLGKNKLDTYHKIKFIKDGMNKKRFLFSWDHLNDFY